MGIKLKNINKAENKNIKLNIIAVVIMIIITTIIMNMYPIIKENGSKARKGKYFTNQIGDIISSADFFLLKDITDYENKKNNSLEDVYIKSYELNDDAGYDYNVLEDYIESQKETAQINIKNQLRAIYDDVNADIKYNYKNLEYCIMDKNNNVIKTNADNKLSNYNNIKDKYDFYAQIVFDENGYMSIKNVYGMDEQQLYLRINNDYRKTIESDDVYNILKAEMNNIKNCTIIYGIPKILKYKDDLSHTKLYFERSVNTETVAVFMVTVCIIFLVLSLMVPFKTGIKILYSKIVKDIPLEIAVVGYGTLACIIAVLGTYGVQMTLQGSLIEYLDDLKMGNMYSNVVSNILNIGLWIIAMYSIFTGVMLLKYIFSIGLVNYFRENTILFKLLSFFKKKYLSIKDYIYHLDLRDKSNTAVIKIVLINFLILCVISLIWFFGIGAAIIYSVLLYYVLTKYINNIKDKFSKLMAWAEKISEGNLDVEIKEDLGVFNPVKDVVMNIKNGFKNAVSEEVKSQKMKTELISNVSHDLKTPLTSIITYVDLLKKEDITEEERNSYIDTLDKKSQRLKVLIEDLFEVSKATSGNIKINLMDVDIVSLMRQTVIELEDKFKQNNLILKCSYPENKIILSLDSSKTYRIFENLLNNATKYAMKNSRVYVDIADHENQTEITIKNMSANEIDFTSEEIVERFQRGDKSRNTEGSGLGLAIAKSFTEAQNGIFNLDVDGDLFKVTITLNKSEVYDEK